MKAYLTFQSSITDPSGIHEVPKKVMRPVGRAHAMVFYNALARVGWAIREPRLYYPTGCWGFPCLVHKVRVLLLVQASNQDVWEEGTSWKIELTSLDIAELLRRRRVSTALDAIQSMVATLIVGDGRFSGLQQYTAKQFRQIGREISRTKVV